MSVNKNLKSTLLLEIFLVLTVLGIYLGYLHSMKYPINWLLVAFLTVICVATGFFLTRKRNNKQSN